MKAVKKIVEAFAPATVANVGCGFDILGFAINGIGDRVKIKVTEQKGALISKITGTDKLPYEIEKNTAGMSILSMMQEINADFGVEIEIIKGMALGSGMGSSAASSVAAVVALNGVLEYPLDKSELLKYALKGEEVASGAMHGDNVIPSLFGGFTLIYNTTKFEFLSLDYPEELTCLVIHPNIQINTSFARGLLDKEIKIADVISQTGSLGRLITGLVSKKSELIRGSINDYIAEPKRASLIPNYWEIKKYALESGALGVNISGSGPSIFCLFDGEDNVIKIAENIKNLWIKAEIESQYYISKINQTGATVVYSE
ncbi:MAG: homoserine kinase [Ignavibacteriaceae bacterium]|nr:homoserine kinase [Ignavibacteriaceae bacterium]